MNMKEWEEYVNKYKSKETEASATDLEFGLKLEIDEAVYRKVMYWVHKSPYEISGLGNVIFDQERNVLRVISCMLLPQKNTGTSTDIEGADVAKAMFQMRNEPGQLRWWWHSHVNMNVFWSGTDLATIKELGNGGWYSATVFNKRNEVKSAFCQKSPVRLLVSDVPTQVFVNKQITDQWDTEYEKNVEVLEESFRRKIKEEEEIKQKTKETFEEDVDSEWGKITDENGKLIRYYRKKNNLEPVQRKSLSSKSLKSSEENIENKKGQLFLPDMAEEEELENWHRSSSDNKNDYPEDEVIQLATEEDYNLAVDEYFSGKKRS